MVMRIERKQKLNQLELNITHEYSQIGISFKIKFLSQSVAGHFYTLHGLIGNG